MLLYLNGHYHPDIAYAVNFSARYMFIPKHLHELSLNIIGQNLKAKTDRGLVLSIPTEHNIDFYPDADFSVIYGYEKANEPACVEDRFFLPFPLPIYQ